MGPKTQTKKPGDDIDLSDIASLPPVNSFNIQIHYSKFKSTASRNKIQEFISKNLPEERIKNITRADIVEYGKSKGIIEEGAAPNMPVPDGAKSYEKMLAHSAADKIFEMKVNARKSKKEKQIRNDEENSSKLQNDPSSNISGSQKTETDTDFVDVIFNMPDYPTSPAEFLALSQYGYTINCIFEIFQVQESLDGSAPTDLKTAKEVAESKEPNEQQHFKSVVDQIKNIQNTIQKSAKNAPLRNCGIFKVPFCDAELVEFKQNEAGEQTTNTMTAEQYFLKSLLIDFIETYTALALNYKKFKDVVESNVLMPEKQVINELKELKRAHRQYVIWKSDNEQIKKELSELKLTDTQKEQLSQTEKDELDNQRFESIKSIDQEMEYQKEQNIQNQLRIQQLKKLAQRSLDDERDPSTFFSDSIYKNDFIPDKESSNCVPAILSAMVSQIAIENLEQEFMNTDQFNDGNEIDQIENLFDSYQREIAYDNNLMERKPEQEKYIQPPLKGILPESFNVYQTYDTSTIPIQTLPAGIVDKCKDKAQKIAQREKDAARNIVLPGCNRYMMPTVPQKSLRLRNYENPQFYPFCTLPIEDAERTMQLKAFQQLIKQQNVDEGSKSNQRLTKNKIFERKFDEYLEPDVYRQVLQDALRYEPDIAAQYYTRTDQLLLILHNKINGAKRSSDNKDKVHGQRKWKAPQRIMSDFQGWVEQFGQTVVIPHPSYQPKDNSEPPLRFILEQDALPKELINIDDRIVKNIAQTLNQYFPDDNSIMTSEEYEIGGVKRIKSVITKDGLTFGLRTVQKDSHLPTIPQYGLVSYKPIGDTQLWLNLKDKDSKIVVETIEASRNTRQLIEVKPPPPTAEEIARKEAAKAAEAAAAQKNAKGAKGTVVQAEVVEEKPPEPVYEEAPPSFLDGIFSDNELLESTRGPCSTITLKNGLIVRHLANGDIVQIQDHQIYDPKNENQSPKSEVDRVFLQGGIVLRHFRNLDCELLYPNGEYAYFDRNDHKWTITNEKGFMREYKNGKSKDLNKINCLNQTDPNTGIVTKVRADKVILIQYDNGSLYCQHADGTQIFTLEDGSEIRIEKEGFAPVTYQKTNSGEDMDDWLDTSDLKSLDGQIINVQLPDGCKVTSLKFFKSSQETDREVIKHIYQRSDYSCFIIDSDGDFKIISTNVRSAINDEDERAKLGQDTDFLKLMYTPNEDFQPGVYQGHISEKNQNVHIATRDCERPFIYKLNYQNKLEKVQNLRYQENEDWVQREIKQTEGDLDIEPIGTHKNPFTKSFIFPRIFLVSQNGEAVELLCQDQIDQAIKFSQTRGDTLTTSRVEIVDTSQMNSIQVMSKVVSLQETQIQNEKLGKLQFPEYSWPYVIPRRSEEEQKQLKPIMDQYHYRNITEYSNFEPIKQNSFNEDYNRFTEWKLGQVRQESEFGIVFSQQKDVSVDTQESDQEFYARRINLKIFNERAQQKEPFNRGIFKINFEKIWNKDPEIVAFRKKMTTVEQEEQQIKAELEKRQKAGAQKQAENERAQKDEQLQYWRDKKRAKTRGKVEERLKQYKDKKETPTFASYYHKSRAGIEYFKANPVKPPSDEVLMRMSQRINRSNQQTEKGQSIFDGNSQKSGRSNGHDKQQMNDDKDNPIVALEPEDQLKQASIEKSKKFTSISKHTGDVENQRPEQAPMSLYLQEKIYLKQVEQERILKAEEHHVVKTKDFDVVGNLRKEKPFVKSIVKSNVQSELNEKFITTECITDRRIKISSMANRQYINAPSIEEVRKQGQHQMILQAINKKQTFSDLINQANSMVTAVLHDSLKRSINILPSVCLFGPIKQGEDVEMTISVKNEDSLCQRIHIKPSQDKRLVVKQETYGPIAPGMTRKLIVTLLASNKDKEILGKIKEEIHIVTKSDIFKLNVEAEILSSDQFEALNQEKLQQSGKKIENSRIRSKLRTSIAEGRQQSILEAYKQNVKQEEEKKKKAKLDNPKKSGDDIEEKKDSQDFKEENSNKSFK